MAANDNIHPGIRIGVSCIRFLLGEREAAREQQEDFRKRGKPTIDAMIADLMDSKN